jgi:glycosyltransferase involved in cell wall biosynthesis
VSVGSLTPRKGYGVLIDALNDVRDLPWRATIAGSLDRSPETAALVRRKLSEYGFEERVRLAGQLDEATLSALYSSADVFALASLYEGYGMAFAEAIAHGLPVVASGEGAVRDTVPRSAGFVCAAGDVAGFAEALRSLLSNAALRREKAEGAWGHGQTLPNWASTAATIAQVIEHAAAE